MPGGRPVRCLALLWFCIFLLATVPPATFAGEGRLIVAAASTLSFALREVAGDFEEETDVVVILSFGSTGKLARQIENGAPFDIFFAADDAYIDELDEKGLLLPGTKRVYARGRIVLAVNRDSGLVVKGLKGLATPAVERISIANPAHAPYGIAAKEALISAGVWDEVEKRLVYGENIRQALQFVQTGNVTAGIVSISVADVPGVDYTIIDDSLHGPIDQAVALVKGTEAQEEAVRFLNHLFGPEGRKIMKRYGFMIPDGL